MPEQPPPRPDMSPKPGFKAELQPNPALESAKERFLNAKREFVVLAAFNSSYHKALQESKNRDPSQDEALRLIYNENSKRLQLHVETVLRPALKALAQEMVKSMQPGEDSAEDILKVLIKLWSIDQFMGDGQLITLDDVSQVLDRMARKATELCLTKDRHGVELAIIYLELASMLGAEDSFSIKRLQETINAMAEKVKMPKFQFKKKSKPTGR